LDKSITIYGDGKQVRDVLFIDDLIKAFDLAYENRKRAAGQIYNIGGGPENTMSLHELIELIEELKGKKICLSYDTWRPGDQRIYVGNISMAKKELNWEPTIKPPQGVKMLYLWVDANIKLLKSLNTV